MAKDTLPLPPRGLKALPWRLPIYLYKAGFGWLLGNRFLLLKHVGRTSGKSRYAVLEIIQSRPNIGSYYVVSGFGTHSDWYRNILKNSQVEIQVGRKRFAAESKQLESSQAGSLILAYSQENPGSLKTLSRIMGYEIVFTPEGIRDFGQKIPVIQFSTLNSIPSEKYKSSP
jgi:deazaflavin-dependent oxidoreductase (nitroreductase family)